MIQKWSFVMYVMSSVALGYVILMNSPLQTTQKMWANTETPLSFFGLAILLIIHIVVSGKMHSQEKYKKVIWASVWVMAFSAILLVPGIDQIPLLVVSYFPS